MRFVRRLVNESKEMVNNNHVGNIHYCFGTSIRNWKRIKFYDIEMAILGSALLGFIMSLTEYFVEKQKSMEEFWLQATKVLKELRKIKYLDFDAPAELVLNALQEENSNEWIEKFSLISENTKIEHIAKESLIS